MGERPELADGTGARYRYLDRTPWADDVLPSPVVVSAWGHQLGVPDAVDARIQPFSTAFRA